MAMIGMWGFDDSTGEAGASFLTAGVYNNATARGTAGGSYYTNSNGNAAVVCTFPTTVAAANTIVTGFGYRTDQTSTTSWYRLLDNAGATQISLRFNTTNRAIQIYRGDGSTLLATSTLTMAVNVWYFVEVKANINSSTGSVDVHVDGVSWVTFSGNTQQAAFTTLNSINVGSPISGSNQTFVDDVYVLDSTGSSPYNSYLGDVTVRTLSPTAAGDLTQWTPSTAPNWDAVNEANSVTTDYVGASTTGLKDLYQVADIPTGSTVYAIQNWIYAAKSDAGVPAAPTTIAKGDGGTTRTDSGTFTLSTTYQHFQGPIYTTDPDGDALTVTNVNAMQVGVTT